jgi:hypothetical protein
LCCVVSARELVGLADLIVSVIVFVEL